MSDIEAYSRLMFIDGLIGYLEIRDWAFEKIRKISAPADPVDLRMHHYIYFANLFGAIDFVKDHVTDKQSKAAFEEALTQAFPHPSDYPYARELRNSIVHRGLDPTAGGIVQGSLVLVGSPPLVFSVGGKKGYASRYPLLVDLAAACNKASNAVIFETLDQDGHFDTLQEEPDRPGSLASLCASLWTAQEYTDQFHPPADGEYDWIDPTSELAEILRSRLEHLLDLLRATVSD